MNNTTTTAATYTREDIKALDAIIWAKYGEEVHDDLNTRSPWSRMAGAGEDAYEDIMDGGYGELEYEGPEFCAIVIWRINTLARLLDLTIA